MHVRHFFLPLLLLFILLIVVTACDAYQITPGAVITVTPKGFSPTHVSDIDSPFRLSNTTASSVTLCVVQNSQCASINPLWYDPTQQGIGWLAHLPPLYTLLPHSSLVFGIDDCNPPNTYIIAIVRQGHPTAQRLQITDMIGSKCGVAGHG